MQVSDIARSADQTDAWSMTPIVERLEHIAQLALRIEIFAARVDMACDRLVGPAPDGGSKATTGESHHDTVIEKLDFISGSLESGLFRLAEACDRMDGAV